MMVTDVSEEETLPVMVSEVIEKDMLPVTVKKHRVEEEIYL